MKKILTVLLVLIINISFSQSDNFKYTVEIPEAFELANVLIALTDFGEADDNIVKKNTTYYDSVIVHFSPFKDHILISKLNALFSKPKWENYKNYSSFRTGSWFYAIDNGELVKKKSKYRKNLFDDFKKDINDFIVISDYIAFYNKHSPIFQDYILKYKVNVSIEEMVDWLNSHFPSRYDQYHIVMSPLISGFHNTTRFKTANGHLASFMAISLPYQFFSNQDFTDYTQGQNIRIVFTEIDHQYINPISDKYKRKIKRSLKDISCWNNRTQSYNSAYLTFNEYMTWAVYSVFIRDYFDDDTFEKLNKSEAAFMQNQRGFTKFKAFNDHLLNLTAADPNKKLEDFVPDMLEWMSKQKCTNVN